MKLPKKSPQTSVVLLFTRYKCMCIVFTPCLLRPCRAFLQRMAANANLLCWELMEGRASRMELLPHSYSSSCSTDTVHSINVCHQNRERGPEVGGTVRRFWPGQSDRLIDTLPGTNGAGSISRLPALPGTSHCAGESRRWCESSWGRRTVCPEQRHLVSDTGKENHRLQPCNK